MAAIGRGGAIVIENRRDSAESLRPRNRAAGASIAFAAILSCVIVLAGLLAVYPSIDAAIRFMLYVLVFNLLPGMVVARLVFPGLNELGSYLLYALSMGIAVNLLISIPLWMMGAPQWLVVLPFAAAAAFVILQRRRQFAGLILGSNPGQRIFYWAAAALLVTATPLLSMQYFLAGDPGGAYSFHFGFEALVVQDLARGWPPPNLMLADVPLHYHYAAHLWILAAHQISGVSVEILAGRFGPVFLAGCAAAQIMAFCRYTLRLRWGAASLPVISVFWIVGVPAIAAKVFATFTALAATLLMSPSLAFIIFFITASIICEDLRRQDRPVGWTAAMLALMAFLLTGARAVGPPVLICAVTLLWAVELWRARKFPGRMSVYLLACVAGFVAGLLVFFRIGGAYDGLGFASFTGEPFTYLTDPPREGLFTFPALLMAMHVPRLLAGMAAFLVMVLGQAGFLLPTLLYDLRDMAQRGAAPAQIFLLGASIAGIAAVFLAYAPGHSQFTFLQYSNICLSMMGAEGAQRIVSSDWFRLPGWKRALKAAALLCAAMLLALQLAQLPPSSLNWVARRTDALREYLREPADGIASMRSIASCFNEKDAGLLAIAARSADHPVVLLLPASTGFSRSEQVWWTVLYPVQTIQTYAIAAPPGKASGALKALLDKRAGLVSALVGASLEGRLSVPDLFSLAESLSPGTPFFAIVDKNLSYDAAPRIHAVAHSERYQLIRIDR